MMPASNMPQVDIKRRRGTFRRELGGAEGGK